MPGPLTGVAIATFLPVPSTAALGALAALGSAATWAVTGLLVRGLFGSFNAVTINAVRSSIGGAMLLVFVVLSGGTGKLLAVSPRAFSLLLVSIVIAIALGDTVFFESTRSLGLGRAMTVATTYPLVAVVLAAIALAEPVTVSRAAGSMLTVLGLGLIVLARRDQDAGGTRFWAGLGAAALAALSWAVSVVLIKVPLREIDATTAQAIRLPLAAVVLWATPWSRGVVGQLRACRQALRWRIALVGALTAASSVMFVAGLKYGDVAVATVLSSTAPMFALPLGLVFLGERFSASALFGVAVTVAGVVLVQWGALR